MGIETISNELYLDFCTQKLKQQPNRVEIWKPKPTGLAKLGLQAVIFAKFCNNSTACQRHLGRTKRVKTPVSVCSTLLYGKLLSILYT